MKKWWVIAFVVLVAAAAGLVRGYRTYKRFFKFSEKVKEGEERSRITNITLRSMVNGKLVWTLRAREGFKKEGMITLDEVEIEYSSGKLGKITVKARKGKLDRKKEVGVLEGDVRVLLENGILKTSRLKWFIKEDKICAPGEFVFAGKYSILGSKLCIFPKEERIIVNRLKRAVMR